MPKIIENVRELLLTEARRQIIERGYSSVTVRSVAKASGVGIGTVYNYFPSKDMLIATFMLDDWQVCTDRINYCCKQTTAPETVFRCVYDELNEYMTQHKALFADKQAVKVFSEVFTERHKQLRIQIAKSILPICNNHKASNSEFLAEFIAEALLTWTVAGRSYEDIASVLLLLFK